MSQLLKVGLSSSPRHRASRVQIEPQTVRKKLDANEQKTPSIVPTIIFQDVPQHLPRAALSPQELRLCGEAFQSMEGGINSMSKLQTLLKRCGQNVTNQSLIECLGDIPFDSSFENYMDLGGFLKLMEILKAQHNRSIIIDDDDLLDAFIAMGGNPDKTGLIPISVLNKFCSNFGLKVEELESLVNQQAEESDELDFNSFINLMKTIKAMETPRVVYNSPRSVRMASEVVSEEEDELDSGIRSPTGLTEMYRMLTHSSEVEAEMLRIKKEKEKSRARFLGATALASLNTATDEPEETAGPSPRVRIDTRASIAPEDMRRRLSLLPDMAMTSRMSISSKSGKSRSPAHSKLNNIMHRHMNRIVNHASHDPTKDFQPTLSDKQIKEMIVIDEFLTPSGIGTSSVRAPLKSTKAPRCLRESEIKQQSIKEELQHLSPPDQALKTLRDITELVERRMRAVEQSKFPADVQFPSLIGKVKHRKFKPATKKEPPPLVADAQIHQSQHLNDTIPTDPSQIQPNPYYTRNFPPLQFFAAQSPTLDWQQYYSYAPYAVYNNSLAAHYYRHTPTFNSSY